MPLSIPSRVFRILVALLAAFLISVFLFLQFYLNPLLREKLITAVAQGSNGLYSLEVENLRCNPLTGSASVERVHLRTDTALLARFRREQPEKRFSAVDLQVSRLGIARAAFLSSYFTRNIRLGTIDIVDPVLLLEASRDSVVAAKPDSLQKSLLERLPELLSPFAQSLSVDRFSVDNGRLEYHTTLAGKHTVQTLDSLHWTLKKIYVEKNPRPAENRPLYSDDLQLAFKNYRFSTSVSPYALAIGSAEMSDRGRRLLLRSVSTGPTISDDAFVKSLKIWRRARLRFEVATLEIGHLDLYRLFHRGECRLETVEMDHGKLDVLVDKHLERVPAKRMPNEIMRALDFQLSVDSIRAQNIDIILTEVKPEPEGRGEIRFSNAHVRILNLSNDPARMSDATPARIYASCQLMDRARLDAAIAVPLLSRDFACSYQATLGAMPMTALNPLFVKDNLIIEEGDLKSIALEAQARNGVAHGTLTAVYDHLKIKLVKPDDKKKGAPHHLAGQPFPAQQKP